MSVGPNDQSVGPFGQIRGGAKQRCKVKVFGARLQRRGSPDKVGTGDSGVRVMVRLKGRFLVKVSTRKPSVSRVAASC